MLLKSLKMNNLKCLSVAYHHAILERHYADDRLQMEYQFRRLDESLSDMPSFKRWVAAETQVNATRDAMRQAQGFDKGVLSV